MEQANTYVGLDVHQREIVVAMVGGDRARAWEWKSVHDTQGVRRLVNKLKRRSRETIVCAYEAEPWRKR